ncbi:MAG: hypothetical protein QNL62_13910 [Gammaproteobacteria bacterium]|nr:hypothetical protein [Gammaproteobacteria bacterium]
MDPKQLKEFQVFIAHYRENVPDFSTTMLRHFDDILKQVSIQFPECSVEPWSESVAALALTLLGPKHVPLPQDILQHFLTVTEQYQDTSQDRMLECAVAYGCGKWRQINKHDSAWHREWNSAILLLSQAIEPAVKEANLWLSDHVINYAQREFWLGRNPILNEGAGIITSDAMMLALQLISPVTHYSANENKTLQIVCDESHVELSLGDEFSWQDLQPGGRVVFEVAGSCELLRDPVRDDRDVRVLAAGDEVNILATDEGAKLEFSGGQSGMKLKYTNTARLTESVDLIKRTCSCGHKDCNHKHNLDNWDAGSRITLWSYCASAVKGPHVNLHTGTFVQGMYYALLSKQGNFEGNRVRLVPVEYKLCQTESCQEDDGPHKFEGLHCLWCDVPGLPSTTPRALFQRLIVNADFPVYERQKRYRCRENHVFRGSQKKRIENLCEQPVCPLCSAELNKHRPVFVWVRTFSQRLSLDEMKSKDFKLGKFTELYTLDADLQDDSDLDDLLESYTQEVDYEN